MKDRKAKEVLSGDGYQWEGERCKERVKGEEYGILHSCMKVEQ
jgi:hypothetical protein